MCKRVLFVPTSLEQLRLQCASSRGTSSCNQGTKSSLPFKQFPLLVSFSVSYVGEKAMLAYTRLQQWKKEGERLTGVKDMRSSLLILDLEEGSCITRERKKKARQYIDWTFLGS